MTSEKNMKETTRLDCLVAITYVQLYNDNKTYRASFCFNDYTSNWHSNYSSFQTKKKKQNKQKRTYFQFW